MKIAYISSDFGIPVFGYKGASVHIRALSSALSRLNNEVTVISPCIENYSDTSNEFSVIKINKSEEYDEISRQIRVINNQIKVKNKLYNDINKYLYNLTLYNSLLTIFKNECFDLVYERYSVFNYAGISIARKFGIPHFLEVNAPLCDEHDSMIGFSLKDLAYSLEKKILNITDQIFVVSDNLKRFAEDAGASPGKIHILPNGVDTSKFKYNINDANKISSQYKLDNKIVIGFVGNIRPWHGIDKLIKSFDIARDKDKDIVLLIVGNSHNENEVENLIRKSRHSESIICTGFINHQEVPSYISAMDITVAPYKNIKNFYFSPMKILEYMACGKPVIAAKLGQINEIIVDRANGLLYKAGDVESLSNSLSYLIKNDIVRKRLGNSGYDWVKKNRSWVNNAREISELYSDISGNIK